MPEIVGFQTMVILDPNGMTFDAVGAFGLAFQLLFKSGSSYCDKSSAPHRAVVTGGTGGTLAHPESGSSVNPIPTRRGRLCPPYYWEHPRIWKPNDSSAPQFYVSC